MDSDVDVAGGEEEDGVEGELAIHPADYPGKGRCGPRLGRIELARITRNVVQVEARRRKMVAWSWS